jgi:Glycosyl transferase family 2
MFLLCSLLIKDDNDILNEWLAYHYHSVRLRDLIVAIDPLSTESPQKILDKWRLMTDLEVYEWTDDNYMPRDFLKTGQAPEKYMQRPEDFLQPMTADALVEISNHRYRQRVFLAQCLKTMKARGRTWVMHIDTDEYVQASKLLRRMKPNYLRIPPIEQPGSVLSLLQQAINKTSVVMNYPCVSTLRVLFGSVESPLEEQFKEAPAGYNATTFESMRWKFHALPHNMSYHGNPKVLLDVSVIPDKYFRGDVVFSIHRPVRQFCAKNNDLVYTNFRRQPIAVNHYLGSWERYSGRSDKRRSRDVYNAKASVNHGFDGEIRPWLRGFVSTMGNETATHLLGKEHLVTPGVEIPRWTSVNHTDNKVVVPATMKAKQ